MSRPATRRRPRRHPPAPGASHSAPSLPRTRERALLHGSGGAGGADGGAGAGGGGHRRRRAAWGARRAPQSAAARSSLPPRRAPGGSPARGSPVPLEGRRGGRRGGGRVLSFHPGGFGALRCNGMHQSVAINIRPSNPRKRPQSPAPDHATLPCPRLMRGAACVAARGHFPSRPNLPRRTAPARPLSARRAAPRRAASTARAAHVLVRAAADAAMADDCEPCFYWMGGSTLKCAHRGAAGGRRQGVQGDRVRRRVAAAAPACTHRARLLSAGCAAASCTAARAPT
jgi:hypothetical protein